MANSSGRADADEPADEAERSSGRSASTDALWANTRIDPVEIDIPGGAGLTLRAYRPAAGLWARQNAIAEPELDDFDAAAAAVAERRRASRSDYEADDQAAADVDEFADEDQVTDETEEMVEEDIAETDLGEAEDVPAFLSRRGRLYLFRSPESLVDFVRSGAEHDLSQLDTWSDLASRVKLADIAPLDEDTYELDLVVDNLRGGPDAWDAKLILKAGELARDLGYALRIEPVLTALAAGSPLDELDEALRAADNGGIGGFLARRRLRRAPAQQSALAWRGIIGRISTAVDWRD